MKPIRDLSIRSKLTWLMMLTTVLALVISSLAMIWLDQGRFRSGMVEAVCLQARIIAGTCGEPLKSNNPQATKAVLTEMGTDPHLMAAAVYDARGRLFAAYFRNGQTSPAQLEPGRAFSEFQADSLEVFQPILSAGKNIGMAYLKVDLDELHARSKWSINVGFITLVIAALVALIFANRVQQIVSRPIIELSEMSRLVTEYRNYSLRAFKHGNDELGQFMDSFNTMLTEIQKRDADLQDARTDLEKRVKERTTDLTKANDRLSIEIVVTMQAREQSEVLRAQLEGTVEHLRLEIQQRTEAQQALRVSEERFFKAFKSSPVPLAILSRRTRTFIDVNDRFVELVQLPREVLIGCPVVDAPLWSAPETRARLEQLFEKGFPVRNWQCSVGRKSDSLKTALMSSESFTLGDDPSVLLMIEDISERANLEAQLRQSQKMEAIGQLASGVAHDFNNLLTIIQGHTQLVLSTNGCTEKGRVALGKVVGASQRAAQLTKQLLTFSRKQAVSLKTLDLNQVIQGVTGMLGPLLGESVKVNWKPVEKLSGIEADAGMLEQVIINLAVNARDAMPNGGTLILSTTLCEIDTSYTRCQPQARPGSFVCLEVGDTGSGMDAKTLERIFEPFFTTKEVGKGTGLGLATVYGIVKQHNGWVEVVSQVGVGTTFKVFLPAVVSQTVEAATSGDSNEILGGRETILVVEDESVLRELVTQILRDFGYDVMEAPHGKEAINVWQRAVRKPELLVTDMMMPEGMTGWELAENLRGRAPELKVIYTSGYSTELFANKLELGDRASFLPKPYNPRTLAKVVRDCLDN